MILVEIFESIRDGLITMLMQYIYTVDSALEKITIYPS